jgi:hypothetical protein
MAAMKVAVIGCAIAGSPLPIAFAQSLWLDVTKNDSEALFSGVASQAIETGV